MIEQRTIKEGEKEVEYIKIDMYSAPVVMVKGKKGYVMCGYLNLGTAEKLGDAGAMVRGVKDLETLLDARIEDSTSKGKDLGLLPGARVRDVLHLL